MKKFKILVTGKNKIMIDDFFDHMTSDFDLLTCSNRADDMERHIQLFEPDIFLVCMNDERRTELAGFVEFKRKLARLDIPTVVVGTEEECDLFESIAVQLADYVILRPITIEPLQKELLYFALEMQQEKEAREEMKKQLVRLKEKPERKHVLVVDDDPIMLKLIRSYLGEDYDVATAVNGKLVHKFLETKTTDLILLDYEMPGENGPEILAKIRENEKLSHVPVVFLTGVTDREKIKQALVLKPQGYLVKPVDKEKLLGVVEKFMG